MYCFVYAMIVTDFYKLRSEVQATPERNNFNIS